MIQKIMISFLMFVSLKAVAISELPPAISQVQPKLTKVGEGLMTFWGFDVYDISYWSMVNDWKPDTHYALALTYKRNFVKKDIVNRSIEEMRGQGWDEAKLQKWRADLDKVLVDVSKGDVLIGLNLPGEGAVFYKKDTETGRWSDPELSQAFFGIWLSPKTSAPKVRKKLLKI